MQKSNRVVSLLFMLAGASTLFAQSESASIVGSVTDSTGAAMPGVAVTIRNTRTNAAVTAQTAADGNFASPPLQPGPYSATVEAQGFSKMIQTLNLDIDQHARVDFALKPGQVSE